MKYEHIARYVANTMWAIDPAKLGEILSVLAYRAAGHEFTREEIQARIGAGSGAGPRGASQGAVAVVPLRGTIAHRMGTMDESSGGMSAERFTAMFRQLAADESVSTIVIDCDSPGGTIPGVPEAADEVFAARASKQIIAVANSQMCSAAYWICSQAHEIVGIPSALESKIGSIGAYFVHQDMSAALEKEGVKVTIISAGARKVDGNEFTPLSAEREAELKAMATNALKQFATAVARGRGVSVSAVLKGFGEGLALPAVEAKAAGLIDRIDTMDGVIGKLLGKKSSVGMMAEGVPGELAALDADRALRLRLL